MKKLPLKIALLLTVLFASSNLFAQDFQGKAYYISKTTMDMDQFGGQDMTPERKKQIQERMKSFLEKEYTLTFTKSESIYKEEEKLEAPGSGGGRRGFGASLTGGPKYKNIQTKELLQDQEFFGKQFLVKDELKEEGLAIFFKADDAKDLAKVINDGLKNKPNLYSIGRNAQQYVIHNRNWNKFIMPIVNINKN